jgi:hypothetical protein
MTFVPSYEAGQTKHLSMLLVEEEKWKLWSLYLAMRLAKLPTPESLFLLVVQEEEE